MFDQVREEVATRGFSFVQAGDMADLLAAGSLDLPGFSASWNDLADVLLRRYGGLVNRVIPYLEYTGLHDSPELRKRWSEVAGAFAATRVDGDAHEIPERRTQWISD